MQQPIVLTMSVWFCRSVRTYFSDQCAKVDRYNMGFLLFPRFSSFGKVMSDPC